jgi:uncharacterized protein
MMRIFFSLLVALALAGCAGTIRDRIYQPAAAQPAPAWAGATPQVIQVTTSDGLTLSGLFWPPRGDRRDIIVYFHGNGGSLHRDGPRAAELARAGHGVVMASYRGYSGNPGRPTEAGLHRDAQAFADYARTLLSSGGRLYLFGHSLGAAVALGEAARRPVDGVATLGAFTRIADMSPGIVRPFLPDRFDNLATIARVTSPVVLFHGTADAIVPYDHAQRLAGALPSAMLVTLESASHHPQMDRLAPYVWQALTDDMGSDGHPPLAAPWR